MPTDLRQWQVQELVRMPTVVFCQAIAVQDDIVGLYSSGIKKPASCQAAVFQSFGCICLIVDGGTAARAAIIVVIALASNVIFGGSENMSSSTGLPARSMSPAVGSRNLSSLTSSPLAMITLRNVTVMSAPLSFDASVFSSAMPPS